MHRIVSKRVKQMKNRDRTDYVKSKDNDNPIGDKFIKGNVNIGEVLAISKDKEDMIDIEKAITIDHKEGMEIKTNVEEET